MSSVTGLSSTYTALLQQAMSVEKQKLTTLQTKKSNINTTLSVYNDVATKLTSLQTAVNGLRSSNYDTKFKAGRSTSVSGVTGDNTVLSGTASSSATTGSYKVAVTNLAQAQQWASAEQSSADLALGKTGTYWLGGTGTASASVTANSTVASVTAGTVIDGLSELGKGTSAEGTSYSLEVRQNSSGAWQFRLKDADGNTVKISDKDGKEDSTTTTDWQNFSAGETYDTGRGLTFTFGDNPTAGSTSIDYTAAGTQVEVLATDSLKTIAAKINKADQPDGREVSATVIGKSLVFAASETGTKHSMVYSYTATSGGDWGTTAEGTVAAEDAEFTVNGLSITRSSNSNLTDVVNGVTLNLASDAEGQTATLNIASDMKDVTSSIEDFISQFNSVQEYLKDKTGVTVDTSGDTTTYTRGALANDSAFSQLRSDMFLALTNNYSGSAYQSLREIGITIDDELNLSISDSDALQNALSDNFSDVESLFTEVMDKMYNQLGRFTGVTGGDNGYLDGVIESTNNEMTDVNSDIKDMNSYLTQRQAYLSNQYAQLQAQMTTLSYLQETLSSLSSISLYS